MKKKKQYVTILALFHIYLLMGKNLASFKISLQFTSYLINPLYMRSRYLGIKPSYKIYYGTVIKCHSVRMSHLNCIVYIICVRTTQYINEQSS